MRIFIAWGGVVDRALGRGRGLDIFDGRGAELLFFWCRCRSGGCFPSFRPFFLPPSPPPPLFLCWLHPLPPGLPLHLPSQLESYIPQHPRNIVPSCVMHYNIDLCTKTPIAATAARFGHSNRRHSSSLATAVNLTYWGRCALFWSSRANPATCIFP